MYKTSRRNFNENWTCIEYVRGTETLKSWNYYSALLLYVPYSPSSSSSSEYSCLIIIVTRLSEPAGFHTVGASAHFRVLFSHFRETDVLRPTRLCTKLMISGFIFHTRSMRFLARSVHHCRNKAREFFERGRSPIRSRSSYNSGLHIV